jgi:uncharacterized protein (TIGR03437 family)
VTVSFDAPAAGSLPAISVPGHIAYVSPTQVNVFVPWELEGYPSAKVKVIFFESLYSNLANLTLANYAPAFFLELPDTAVAAVDNTTGAVITAANPATAGEILQLYANGLGPVTNQPASGDPATVANLPLTGPVTVTIGGKQAQVFGGTGFLAPPYVGLYQVNIAVPSGLSPGKQPITVSVGGQTSATTALAGTTYQGTVYLPVK